MQRILVLNPKGGSGKTTIATNLASYFASQGDRPLLSDNDPQGSSTRWLKKRKPEQAFIHGIAAFERLIVQVMRKQPYRSARRVFLIADNGSSHRGQPASDRLRAKWPNIVLVHTPVHASWLNQIEVYFSVVQRKLLTPSDFANRGDLERGLLAFQARYQRAAKPFKWTFTRRDLRALLTKLMPRRACRNKPRPNTSP